MTIKPIAALVAATLAVSACTTDSVSQANKSQTGAIIGGALGGLIGASSNDDKLLKGIVGAGIGAAAGGVIGHQLDKQAEDLRRDIPNENIDIVNTGEELRVTMPQDLLFAVNSSDLRYDLQADLRALAGNLRDYPDTTVNIVGHTDDTGSDGYNYELSERRAQAVAFTLEDAGVTPSRIRSYGQGETRPVASNVTEEGRAQNRRVDIVIRPNAA
ncbi:outer membrane protein OmpA-like peptidoglycan-associated protein [Litoreibacter meonggei]|uniref:Outer membrane protein OmpA-like peptidoglycan-associated protein n=1 Tax=Litoreibacter meonggei TaxID=1049199 RepID=A0A497W589_9RHOB|nr:OmpA family protein [Litoreibacter meonggei]RLJ51611.1 outer membrane protein OmpA-like peptidoglycan-associated protein [Litoreibacter meonggei]